MMNFLDFKTIQHIITERHNEKKAQKARKQELIERHLKETELLKKVIDEKRRASEEKHQQILAQRKQEQEAFLRKAEEQAIQSEREDEREVEALRIQNHHAIQKVVFEGISQCQIVFRDKYTAVHKLLIACHEFASAEHNNSLKELIQKFEQLINKIKSNEYGPAELLAAQRICESIETLEKQIVAELEAIIIKSKEKAEESFRQLIAEEAERKQQEAEQEVERQQEAERETQRQQEAERETQSQQEEQKQQGQKHTKLDELQKAEDENVVNMGIQSLPTNQLQPQSQAHTLPNLETEQLNAYTKVMEFYQHFVDKINDFKNDDSLKKYRFACQKAINTPINAISAVSPQHMQDKFDKLYGFINGQPSNDVRVTDHPLGRDYCLLLMARRFVSQGSTVSVKPQAAFAYASVLVSLWKLLPELGQLFLAYLYKDSPYMVPCLLRQQNGQSEEDYLKQLGFHFTNGQIESVEMYLKRQAGIARLYAAVVITNGRAADGPSHPHGLANAWRWLTKFIMLGPQRDISSTIITEFLQLVGLNLYTSYGKQFIKLLIYIQQIYFPQLSIIDVGGPKARLELQLNKFLREGRIDKLQGMVEYGFW